MIYARALAFQKLKYTLAGVVMNDRLIQSHRYKKNIGKTPGFENSVGSSRELLRGTEFLESERNCTVVSYNSESRRNIFDVRDLPLHK